jgi:hypothetical protein
MKSFKLRHFKHSPPIPRSGSEKRESVTIPSGDFHKAVPIHNSPSNTQPVITTENTYANEKEEALTEKCYVHFAIHGALNSQRSQLENAMTIASLLKCTLVLPYVQLGKTLSWHPFDTLSRLSHKNDRECAYSSNKKVQDEGLVCSEFSDLFDMRNVMVEARLKMIDLKQFSKEVGVDMSNPSNADSEHFWSLVQQSNNIVNIKDQFHGCYLMYDSQGYLDAKTDKSHHDRALHALDKKKSVFDVLDLNNLRLKSSLLQVASELSATSVKKGTAIEFHGVKRNTPAYSTVYRFGSLDGLERLTLSMNQKSLRNHIHSSMIYSNEILHSVAQGI